MNLVERLRKQAKHLWDIGGGYPETVALMNEAADALEEFSEDVRADVVSFSLISLPHTPNGYNWEPQRWWSMPRVGELVNLPPHHSKAYVNTNGKALYRVIGVEYVRDGEVIIRVEGPLNG